MKKGILALSIVLLLSGCGTQMPNLTEEQNRQVAEYAAGLLMKYDTKHASRLLSDAELEKELARLQELARRKEELAALEQERKEEQEREKEQKEQALSEIPVIEQGANGPAGQYIEDFYGIDGITIRYQGYEITDAYPQGGEGVYFRMQASSGKKLLVVKFTASNNTAEEKSLDMISLMPRFKIGINGETARYALSTLLLDDLANYRGTLAAGEEVQLVLMAEVSEELAGNINSISLIMQNDSNSATILLN